MDVFASGFEMPSSDAALQPILTRLQPVLDDLGLRRSDDQAGFALYERNQADDCERLGFRVQSTSDSRGRWTFAVACGLEWTALDRQPGWIVLPGTHWAATLDAIVRAPRSSLSRPPREFPVTVPSDADRWIALLGDWIPEAFRILDQTRDERHRRILADLDARTRVLRQRFKLLGQRISECRTPTQRRQKLPPNLVDVVAACPWNVLQILQGQLASAGPQRTTLDLSQVAFERDTDDRTRPRAGLRLVQHLLDTVLQPADVDGPGSDSDRPDEQIAGGATWRIGRRRIVLSVVHPPGREQELVLGVTGQAPEYPLEPRDQDEAARGANPDSGGRPSLARGTARALPTPKARSAKKNRKPAEPTAGKPVRSPSPRVVAQRAVRCVETWKGQAESAFGCVADWSLADDVEAHDAGLQDRIHQAATERFQSAATALSERYGDPARTTAARLRRIPHNGVLESRIWSVEGQLVYLVLTHEDRELPVQILVGRTVGPRTSRNRSSS